MQDCLLDHSCPGIDFHASHAVPLPVPAAFDAAAVQWIDETRDELEGQGISLVLANPSQQVGLNASSAQSLQAYVEALTSSILVTYCPGTSRIHDSSQVLHIMKRAGLVHKLGVQNIQADVMDAILYVEETLRSRGCMV